MKILLIDDDSAITEIVSELILLQVSDAEIEICNRPILLLKSKPTIIYDAAISDYWMRGVTAEEILPVLKAKKFYVMTGDSRVLLPGVAMIQKPFIQNVFSILKAS